jgi:uncharacterized protein DUF3309
LIPLAIVLTLLVALGVVPFVSRRRLWRDGARGGVGLVLLIVLALFLTGWL